MSASFDELAGRGAAKLRAAHDGLTIRPPRCETAGAGSEARYSAILDIRGPEFQELVAGKAAGSVEKALDAAFEEAGKRLRRRAERQPAAMRVVLACAVS